MLRIRLGGCSLKKWFNQKKKWLKLSTYPMTQWKQRHCHFLNINSSLNSNLKEQTQHRNESNDLHYQTNNWEEFKSENFTWFALLNKCKEDENVNRRKMRMRWKIYRLTFLTPSIKHHEQIIHAKKYNKNATKTRKKTNFWSGSKGWKIVEDLNQRVEELEEKKNEEESASSSVE